MVKVIFWQYFVFDPIFFLPLRDITSLMWRSWFNLGIYVQWYEVGRQAWRPVMILFSIKKCFDTISGSVQQHILDLFPILFDLPSRLSINFTPILRHVFTKNFKIFKVRSTFPVELKPFINTPIDLTNMVMLFDLDY